MTRTGRQQLQAALGQISVLLDKDPQRALSLCRQTLVQVGKEPNLLHIQGLALSRLGHSGEAMDSLQQSLKLAPKQPEVRNNLGNFFKASGSLSEAESQYRIALELAPGFTQARKNLGLVLLDQEKCPEAQVIFEQLLTLSPLDPSLLTALGNVARLQEHYTQAMQYYEQALEIQPDYVNALNNLGLCYKLTEHSEQAIACYDRALQCSPAVAEIHLNKGNAEFELARYDAAESCYLQAVKLDPLSILAHETLAELRWQRGQTESLTDSHDYALEHYPDHLALHESKIKLLIHCQQYDAAREGLAAAQALGNTPQLRQLSGQLLSNQQLFLHAASEFEKALLHGFDMDVVHDLARARIIMAEYDVAESLLQKCLELEPDNQLNWGLIGLCWRLMSDPRYQWLIDYERDIRVFTLETPPGYASLSDFLQELQGVLLSMHTTKAAPTRQTLVSGTQTPGRLLHKPHPVIQSYRWALEQAVSEYIAGMPDDTMHPLFRRKSEHFEFSGSWSVKLGPGGFHVNHVHPAGWISSACYIHIPEGMGSEQDNEGCLKFGEGPLMLGTRERVERIIKPEAGQLALFPSYAWHGTFDIHCDESDYRLTAPFDVIPA